MGTGIMIYSGLKYPNIRISEHSAKSDGDSEILIENLGRKKNLLIKGNEVDVDRTAKMVLKDWQIGKIKV